MVAYDEQKVASEKCPKHCSKLEYTGKLFFKIKHAAVGIVSKTYFWTYVFPTKQIEVHEEYLLYDEAGFIGSAGGTLGLFIGFSFSDIIIQAMDFLRDHMFTKWF